MYPHVDFRIVFGQINLLVAFPLFRIVSLVTFAPLLFTSLRVVAARLLTMIRYHAILLFTVESPWTVESILGLIERITALKVPCQPLGIILKILVTVPS